MFDIVLGGKEAEEKPDEGQCLEALVDVRHEALLTDKIDH